MQQVEGRWFSRSGRERAKKFGAEIFEREHSCSMNLFAPSIFALSIFALSIFVVLEFIAGEVNASWKLTSR